MKLVTRRDFEDLFRATENMTNMMRMVQYDQVSIKTDTILIIEKELNVVSAFSLELKKQLQLYRKRMEKIEQEKEEEDEQEEDEDETKEE